MASSDIKKFKVGNFTLFIREKSKCWHYYVTHNNRKIRGSTKESDPTKAKAYVESILIPRFFAGDMAPKKKHTVGQSVDNYLEYCQATKGARTYRQDKLYITKRFREYFKDETSITSITKPDIKKYLLSLKLSPQSTFNHYSTIRAFFNFLKDDEKSPIQVNPCERLDKFLPKIGSEIVKYHEQDQVDKILALAKEIDFELYRIFLLMRYTGIRIEEARYLKPDNFDWTKKILRIKKRKEIGFNIKSHRERDIPFSSKLIKLFRPTIKADQDFIFARKDGQRWETDPTKPLKEFCKKTGLKTTFHMWRHSYAAYWLSSGQDIFILSRILGHSSVEVTQKSYGNFTMQKVQTIVEDLFDR